MSKWRTITINLTHEQSRQLKALAGLQGLSQSAFLKRLLEREVKQCQELASFMNMTGSEPIAPVVEKPKQEEEPERIVGVIL